MFQIREHSLSTGLAGPIPLVRAISALFFLSGQCTAGRRGYRIYQTHRSTRPNKPPAAGR
ncbi:hypothetical protein NH44784_058261 [Achromobacter xylosoxidans NH44784-1996]|nr:hypothetical protein NH44784_058261 [Achromobacter xylosoxidans NH44784-1996]